jgi:hypothetical protein
LGSSAKKDLKQAKAAADTDLDNALTAGNAGYSAGIDTVSPFTQSGVAANKLYSDAIGINGRDAQQGVQDNFLSDPFREQNGQLADEALIRSMNSRGASRGGLAALAVGRANLERGSTDYNNWLNRLSGASSQGLTAAGTEAGLQAGQGDLAATIGQQKAGTAISYGNAMAQNRSTGINNILGIAGTAIKAFTPGFSGGSAIGNIGNFLSGK